MLENWALPAYKAEPEKFARMTRTHSWTRKKAAGLPIRRHRYIYSCEYRDRRANAAKAARKIQADRRDSEILRELLVAEESRPFA
jgi:hypothetical protein